MSDRECILMIEIALIWNFIKVYLIIPLGVSFSFSGWLLETWILFFVAGYLCERLITNENRIKLYLLGAFGFIATVLLRACTHNEFNHACDYSPAFFFLVVSFYDLLRNWVKLKNHALQSVVSFLAQHTFYIYLFHIHVMRYIVPQIADLNTKLLHGYLLETLLIFVCSLICAIVFRTLIMRLLQSILRELPGLRVIDREKTTP